MNELSWEKRKALKRLLAAGVSKRKIAATIRVSPPTVSRYARMWKFNVLCACGQPAGHPSWCKTRLAFSPKRRAWLLKHWGRRSDSDLSRSVDAALLAAKALQHRLGPFVWTADGPALAYALCLVCGKMARILASDRSDGTALRDSCLTRSQRAAIKAAHQEKREWRNGKRSLQSLRQHLRQPNSPIPASAPAPSSPA